ncbi:TRAP transporter large permease [Marinimicrococcus flavescens]|uniref:TRAP transporter large permease protein n=1 Tax=Marinimicrococcus flavescens TaxID=3031815 RepID=A0AAP3V001_9PROT|nr:TRAP transporter large permease subunit [Marinimicrococcus flavescens]
MTSSLLTVLALLAGLLSLGVWVGLSLFGVGAGSLLLFRSMPVDKLLGQISFNATTVPELIALPLFILMGEILFRTELSRSLFQGLAPWTSRLPGKLLHVNVLGCTLFAAISGSSAATTATVGRMTLTELTRRGYDRKLAMGSLAGAGTLGFLIPPSVIMIIYGVLAEVSILKLFIAGILPGFLLALAYMVYLGVRAALQADATPDTEDSFSWGERMRGLVELGPVVFLILMILGSMYGGIASPTEAAAIGVLGAIIISAWQRTLNRATLSAAFMAAVRTSSMVGLIIAGAVFLSVAMGFLGIPRAVAEAIAALELGPMGLVLMLILVYGLLGCVLEGLSMIVMTLPITLPLIVAAGFDPLWFGVFLVLVVEMAQITPPVGFNLFVIQGMTGEPLGRISRAALPFFVIMILFTLLLALFPQIALFLPAQVTLKG